MDQRGPSGHVARLQLRDPEAQALDPLGPAGEQQPRGADEFRDLMQPRTLERLDRDHAAQQRRVDPGLTGRADHLAPPTPRHPVAGQGREGDRVDVHRRANG